MKKKSSGSIVLNGNTLSIKVTSDNAAFWDILRNELPTVESITLNMESGNTFTFDFLEKLQNATLSSKHSP